MKIEVTQDRQTGKKTATVNDCYPQDLELIFAEAVKNWCAGFPPYDVQRWINRVVLAAKKSYFDHRILTPEERDRDEKKRAARKANLDRIRGR